MGSAKSSHPGTSSGEKAANKMKEQPCGVGGLTEVGEAAAVAAVEESNYVLLETPVLVSSESEDSEKSEESDESDDEFSDEDSDEEEEEEEDEDFQERLAILAECQKLKLVAAAYLHPERGVDDVDPKSSGRNYFERASAPPVFPVDEDETPDVISDVKALKTVAVDYLHPEQGVSKPDPTTFGRNYFGVISTSEVITDGNEDELIQISEDAAMLKKAALDYLHPERSVKVADGTLFGRNCLDGSSIPPTENYTEVAEDVQELKRASREFLHPEDKVKVDPTAFGRNYFDGSCDIGEEYGGIVSDVESLKKAARAFLHPEDKVEVDPTTLGRNYFGRFSGTDTEDLEECAEKEKIMEESLSLKKLAVDHMHPEKEIIADPAVFARNYYSSPKSVDDQDEQERSQVLADAMLLKKHAREYCHPEDRLLVDATSYGRNYFLRSSVVGVVEDEKERWQVLADTEELKKKAGEYMHPENAIECDPTAMGRNYFARPTAAEVEEGKDQLLADVVSLKEEARFFAHPEDEVKADVTTFGRSYFSRGSAPMVVEVEKQVEIESDSDRLKKLARDYNHPEDEVTVDAVSYGCNYFSRSTESEADDEDRAQILADAANLKKLATQYLHPEEEVEVSDPCVSGRNYFARLSAPAPETEDVTTVCSEVFADAARLKEVAVGFLHPEDKVVETDPAVFGRNFFNRPSSVDNIPPADDGLLQDIGNEFESGDYFEMELEEDGVFNDMREAFVEAHIGERPPTPTHAVESEIINEEEEGNLSRSPSSVMLFDMAEGMGSRKASNMKLSGMEGNSSRPLSRRSSQANMSQNS